MENGSIVDTIKDFISRYIVFILVFLIVIVIVILLLPEKEEQKPTPTESILTITLKGNMEVSVIKGETYQDPGYTAYDSKEGDLTSRVSVEGSVNSNVIGTYTIKYYVTNSTGKKAEATRTVNVIADNKDLTVDIDYNPKDLTNTEVEITLTATGDGFDFILDPEGNIVKENKLVYKATYNDEYVFSIKRKDGNVIEKSIEVKNIDKKKPTGSCKDTVTLEKSVIVVTAKDENGISKYSYNLNSKKYDSTSNTYTISGAVRNTSVTIYDKAGNYEVVSCITVDNTWPIKQNQNYVQTSAKYYDKTRKYGRLNYLFYYPNDLNLNDKNALVIFLHGSGEFGSNINGSFNSNTAFANNMRDGKFQQRAVFLCPQCNSSSKSWKNDCFNDLKGLIDETVKKYNIDPDRISITGHSLGGGAVYDALAKWPGFFSAAAPLAPAGGSSNYAAMKGVKIAVFTGTNDGLYSSSKNTVTKLQAAGVEAKFYPLEGKGHAAQPPAFNEYNLIEWMIAQTRK